MALLVTHTRDVEGIILQSNALRNVLIEFDLEGAFGKHPELTVINAVAPVGYVRFIAQQNRWTVRSSSLDFRQFITFTTLQCDAGRLCAHMAALTVTSGVTVADYESELKILVGKGHNPYSVARGHDATAFLAWAISRLAGKKRKEGARITADVVENCLVTNL